MSLVGRGRHVESRRNEIWATLMTYSNACEVQFRFNFTRRSSSIRVDRSVGHSKTESLKSRDLKTRSVVCYFVLFCGHFYNA